MLHLTLLMYHEIPRSMQPSSHPEKIDVRSPSVYNKLRCYDSEINRKNGFIYLEV